MTPRLLAGLALLGLAGCTQTIHKMEPPAGTLPAGQKVLVDDGSCPAGQIKQVTGAPSRGAERKRECVPAPPPKP